jgi:ABC-type polysaccharide transport system permease subunit
MGVLRKQLIGKAYEYSHKKNLPGTVFIIIIIVIIIITEVLGMKFKTLYMLDKHSTTEPYLQP